MTEEGLRLVRTRSVDNLQRLYTVVISLALTESLRGLLSLVVSSQHVGYARWLMFSSLLFTVVPFYHGANRYLDATYVTRERHAKDSALMIDFLLLFIEGLGFFAIAAVAPLGPEFFYTGLALLFLLDALWVGITNITAVGDADKFPGYTVWAGVNLLSAVLLLVFVWSRLFEVEVWRGDLVKNIALVSVAIGRTIYDYSKVWRFYYPKDSDFSPGLIPAPAPAPPPVVGPQ